MLGMFLAEAVLSPEFVSFLLRRSSSGSAVHGQAAVVHSGRSARGFNGGFQWQSTKLFSPGAGQPAGHAVPCRNGGSSLRLSFPRKFVSLTDVPGVQPMNCYTTFRQECTFWRTFVL